ncbi:hypothetical protein K456DRAFT_55954 [Colletotrichum gloeosporioides 23]|nr:hypothetical protein K456DRAFT_55954 [Colletotrichum gloeosporioides 23]
MAAAYVHMQLLHCRIAKPPSGADFPSICVAFWAVPSALLAFVPPPANGGGGCPPPFLARPANYILTEETSPSPPIPAFHLLALRPSKTSLHPSHSTCLRQDRLLTT